MSLAGGVTFTLDPMPPGVVAAYVEVTPTTRLRRDIAYTADGYGGAGFLNVPAGVYTVTAKRSTTGERIGSQRIHVRADAFTMMILAPTP